MAETPSSRTISTRLKRIAMLAREVVGAPLRTLAHHIDLEWLKEAADAVRCEAQAHRGAAALTIEDAGDDRVRVVHGETPKEIDGLLIRAVRRLSTVAQVDVMFMEEAAAPTQREMSQLLLAVDGDDHLVEHRAQELFAVAVCGCRRIPDLVQISAD